MSLGSMLKRANAKHPPEDSVALRVSVLVAVEAAALATLAQGIGGPALRAAATVGIAAGFGYSHWARRRDGYLLKALLAAGVLLAFASFLSTLSGMSAGAINEVQLPLAELFLWVQFFHSLDVPARRDLLFSLLSSLVLMAVAAVLSVSPALGPNLVVWAAACLVALVLAHRSEVRALPRLVAAEVEASGGPAAAWRRRNAVVTALGVLVAVSVLASAIFLVVPAAGAGKAVAFPAELPRRLPVPQVGGLANPSLGGADPASPDGRTSSTGGAMVGRTGYFGFSESLDTSVRGRPDRTLVMRVKASRPDFWRGQTFDRWDGRSWSQSEPRAVPVQGWSPIDLRGAREDREMGVLDAGNEFVQTVFVEAGGPNLIFAAYAPTQVYFGDRRLFELSDGTVRTGVQLDRGTVYTVVSHRTPVTEDILRASDTMPVHLGRTLQQRYTQLPSVPDRVRDLAATVTAGAPSTYDKVRALERWMGQNTSYTLDIPRLPADADAVEQYLFVDRKGFCEQIASALVVMLRSLGVPARLAVGYTPGERNPFTGLWEVRGSDAHAWAEVWFPGVGWQAFDPTASVPLAGEPFSSAAGAGLVDFVRVRLPSVPGWLAPALLALGACASLLGAGGWAVGRRVRRRRLRAAMPWPELVLERLELAGARRGRSRREWESARRYSDILVRSVLPDPRLRTVADLVEAEAYSGAPPSQARRAEAEGLMDEIEAAHPAGGASS